MKKPTKVIEFDKAKREVTLKYAIEFEKQRQQALKEWKARQMGWGYA